MAVPVNTNNQEEEGCNPSSGNELEQLESDFCDEANNIELAKAFWYNKSELEQSAILSVEIEELEMTYYRGCIPPFELHQVPLLSDAISFIQDTKSWLYWVCPNCERMFLDSEGFLLHLENEHLPQLPRSEPIIPRRISDNDVRGLKTFSWLPGNMYMRGGVDDTNFEDTEIRKTIMQKIQEVVFKLIDLRILSADLTNKLTTFSRLRVGRRAYLLPGMLSIAFLGAEDLEMIYKLLHQLSLANTWELEQSPEFDEDGSDSFDAVTLVQDTNTLCLDVRKIISSTDGSIMEDDVFKWLFYTPLQEGMLLSWLSMKQKRLQRGVQIILQIKTFRDTLIDAYKSKLDDGKISEQEPPNCFLTETDYIDAKILRIDSEIEYMKKMLSEVCAFDYRPAIMPILKAYIRDKLRKASSCGVFDQDDRYAEYNKNLDSVNQFQMDQQAGRNQNFVDEGNSSRTKVEKARCFVSDHQASIIEQTGTCTISEEPSAQIDISCTYCGEIVEENSTIVEKEEEIVEENSTSVEKEEWEVVMEAMKRLVASLPPEMVQLPGTMSEDPASKIAFHIIRELSFRQAIKSVNGQRMDTKAVDTGPGALGIAKPASDEKVNAASDKKGNSGRPKRRMLKSLIWALLSSFASHLSMLLLSRYLFGGEEGKESKDCCHITREKKNREFKRWLVIKIIAPFSKHTHFALKFEN
ncbi:hypothetical protein OsJ_03816 [Oryza sativa Japonica Group]|uniref:C2H2-type domain-containing protein n=1 Tax=Oryza sativa subsp. japonica TaxID=39947 RepID=B9ETT4_ORYSJ|nr:hypothetical protein OsJ_03816 [Oryza sativa Japonica Group]